MRKNAAIRSLVRETVLSPADLIAPLFVIEGRGQKEAIASMPGYYRYSLDLLAAEVDELWLRGIRAVLLFVKCPDERKDNRGTEALRPDGLMQRSVRTLKEAYPGLVVMTDVALDPYSSYGHDGIVEGERILNDATVEVLAQMGLSHAAAGADFLAPSDMMDGRVAAMREALERENFHETGIMAYSAKYASCFYGPFRDALDSAPGFGDKKTYQMDPANSREALREASLDAAEGADILMVKPAMAYLDVLRQIRDRVTLPLSAYHVSGEYAMIKAAAERGWLDEAQAVMESTTAIKRAGADLIASYFAKDIAEILNG